MHDNWHLLIELLKNQKIELTFTDLIDDFESYAAPGMKCQLLSIKDTNDDCVTVNLSYEGYISKNSLLEPITYYSSVDELHVTPTASGFAHKTDHMYFESKEDPFLYFSYTEKEDLTFEKCLEKFNAYCAL